MSDEPILRVAVPSPLRTLFDYYAPASNLRALTPGVRVRVPFGRRTVIGVLVQETRASDVAHHRMRHALEVLDEAPLLSDALLRVLRWAADYYHHSPGDVMCSAFPANLRQGRVSRPTRVLWRLTPSGAARDPATLTRAPRQRAMMESLAREPRGVAIESLESAFGEPLALLRKLRAHGWVESIEAEAAQSEIGCAEPAPSLNAAQADAVAQVLAKHGTFQPFLLEGITGSGKTEVYLQLTQHVIARGEQVLVLVPEIGLTPQIVERFEQRFGAAIALLHSALGDRERAQAWLAAQQGRASIVVGTRSAVFTPTRKLGLIIVDEEHDLSFKQQDGFRYSARDVAVMRAREEGVPVVLGSATPSLECLQNVSEGRYVKLLLPARAGNALAPKLSLVDVRRQPMQGVLSRALIDAMTRQLDAGHQVLLFLNRRGFAPTLLCHACGWIARCKRCDAHLTLHQGTRNLRCHHCGAEQPLIDACPECQSMEIHAVGAGTERVEETLAQLFPRYPIARIDRDSTRRKGALDGLFAGIKDATYRILIGTQMLAKGHHFPSVTLVGILNTDQGLFSTDFRAAERMAQLIVQVAGRAGRGETAGEVLIQTHFPDHPLLRTLLERGYGEFAHAALTERREAHLPPFSFLALIRAEAAQRDVPLRFLSDAKASAEAPRAIHVLGPVPAPMEKRAGRFRAQLLVQADSRAALHRFLNEWIPRIESLKSARHARWSLDVDPQEMY